MVAWDTVDQPHAWLEPPAHMLMHGTLSAFNLLGGKASMLL